MFQRVILKKSVVEFDATLVIWCRLRLRETTHTKILVSRREAAGWVQHTFRGYATPDTTDTTYDFVI